MCSCTTLTCLRMRPSLWQFLPRHGRLQVPAPQQATTASALAAVGPERSVRWCSFDPSYFYAFCEQIKPSEPDVPCSRK